MGFSRTTITTFHEKRSSSADGEGFLIRRSNVPVKCGSDHFGELLSDFGGVGVSLGALSQRHHHEELEELLLLQLDQVSLQGPVPRTAPQRGVDVNCRQRRGEDL